jgi:hypothetical protein
VQLLKPSGIFMLKSLEPSMPDKRRLVARGRTWRMVKHNRIERPGGGCCTALHDMDCRAAARTLLNRRAYNSDLFFIPSHGQNDTVDVSWVRHWIRL